MVSLREARSPRSPRTLYIVAGSDDAVRALVDPRIARSLPRLRPAVDCIAHVLQRCLADESLVVRITIDRAPPAHQERTSA
ncbi:MAG: hypothetical protein ACODAJ_11155 [Planctomycetota bacterium]